MYPNIDLRAHLTIWGAVFAGCLAVFLTLAAPVWVWLPVEIWLVLWLFSILAIHADERWPDHIVTILRDPDFKQVYQWVTVPFLARVWRRLCDHNPASSSAAATFGAALTARLYDRALLIAVAYPILLPVLIWVATGRAGQMGPVTFLPGTDAWDVWPERAGMVAVFGILTAGLVARKLAAVSRIRRRSRSRIRSRSRSRISCQPRPPHSRPVARHGMACRRNDRPCSVAAVGRRLG